MPVAGPASSRAALLIGATLLAVASHPAAEAADDTLTLSDAWIRMILPSRPAAGYFTLGNDGDAARELTGASSPACGSVMLHQSRTVDGVAKMVMVPKVAVPAHGTLQFAPHGYHLMCIDPSADLAPGQDVPVTLRFEDGAALTGSFEVHGPGDS